MTKDNNSENRKIWQKPWGFPESIAITCGIIMVGFALQLAIGGFSFYLLAFPVNIWIGGAIIVICLLLSLMKNGFSKWLCGIPFSVSLIMALLLLTIIMGLTPQTIGTRTGGGGNIFIQLGFDQMTRSWAFVLIYFTTILSVGSLVVLKLLKFRSKDIAFHTNHIGLWIVLFFAGLGSADIERYLMHVNEGETEWRVFDNDGHMKELPIAIHLFEFDMEEYPPKLLIIDRESGIPQPEGRPDFYQIDLRKPEANIYGWDIKVEEYIHHAIRNSDSTYREVHMPGSAPAVFIDARNIVTGETVRGWVSGGNQAQLYMTRPLTEQYSVVMTQPDPKRFMSDIEVYTADGKTKRVLLEVNKPAVMGSWTIYQFGYDNNAGRMSTYSSMELVYDPWKIPVYIGFALMAIGSILMIWNGRTMRYKNKKNKQDDLG